MNYEPLLHLTMLEVLHVCVLVSSTEIHEEVRWRFFWEFCFYSQHLLF